MQATTGTSWTLAGGLRAVAPSATILHGSSLVGREQELAALTDHVRRHGLLYVTGAAGIGKSALALRTAQKLAPVFRGGYRAIDAARVPDCDHLRALMTAAVRPGPLAHSPAGRPGDLPGLLLLVDNGDRHAACIHGLARLLRRARPDVRVVITSRSPGAAAGASFAVQPLAFPLGRSAFTAPAALEFAAVRLFVQETARQVPAFALTDENTGIAIDVCRRVGGIPLAIKLAAAWVPHVGMRSLPALMGPEVMDRLASYQIAAATHSPSTTPPTHPLQEEFRS